jgi:hypothetical protein
MGKDSGKNKFFEEVQLIIDYIKFNRNGSGFFYGRKNCFKYKYELFLIDQLISLTN